MNGYLLTRLRNIPFNECRRNSLPGSLHSTFEKHLIRFYYIYSYRRHVERVVIYVIVTYAVRSALIAIVN